MWIDLPYSVFINKRFVTTGTRVYVIPIKEFTLKESGTYTVRVLNVPKSTRCIICLDEDEANFIKIKHPQLLNFN